MCHIVEFSCPGCKGHVGPELLPCAHHNKLRAQCKYPVRRLTFAALVVRGFYRCTNAGCLLDPTIHKALMALQLAADARGATYAQAGFAYTAARAVPEGITSTQGRHAPTTTSSVEPEHQGEDDEACDLALSDTEEARADEARAVDARRRRHQQRRRGEQTPGRTARFADAVSVFREDGSGTVAMLPVRWGPGRLQRIPGRRGGSHRPTRGI